MHGKPVFGATRGQRVSVGGGSHRHTSPVGFRLQVHIVPSDQAHSDKPVTVHEVPDVGASVGQDADEQSMVKSPHRVVPGRHCITVRHHEATASP